MGSAVSRVDDQPRISVTSLEECERSAAFWAKHMGHYASDLQQRADNYTIAAVILSTITGLTVWPLLTTSHEWWAQLIVSVMALAAAFVAIVPKTRNYSDGARAATKLAAEYGHHVGALYDVIFNLRIGLHVDNEVIKGVRDAFEATRAEKESLRPFPDQLQEKRNAEEDKYQKEHAAG